MQTTNTNVGNTQSNNMLSQQNFTLNTGAQNFNKPKEEKNELFDDFQTAQKSPVKQENKIFDDIDSNLVNLSDLGKGNKDEQKTMNAFQNTQSDPFQTTNMLLTTKEDLDSFNLSPSRNNNQMGGVGFNTTQPGFGMNTNMGMNMGYGTN